MADLTARPNAAGQAGPAIVLVTMCLGVLISQVDTSVVNLAAKRIGADLGIGVSALQWVLDAYNLVYASLLMTGGMLGDLFGRRRAFAAGVAIFTLGSLICGFAPDGAVLIAGRGLTGLGAALLLPTSLAILAVTYPDGRERAHAIGIWASCNGLAFAIGPTLGGLLVDAAGWRAIFLLIVPISALALALTLRCVPETASPEGRRLDLPGQGLAVAALGALTLAAIEGAHWGWTAPTTLFCAGAGIAAGLAFVAVEARSAGALVPLGLFRRRALSASMTVAAAMTFGMYGVLFLVPIYLQTGRGGTAFEAGIEMLPMSLAFLAVSQRSGRLAARFGPRVMTTLGMAFMGGGVVLLAWLVKGAGLGAIELDFVAIGIGLGLNTGPVMSVAVSSVPPARSGTASGLINTARMVGATLGVAALGAIYASHAGQDVGAAARLVGGMRAAFLFGGGIHLAGAVVAFVSIRRNALDSHAG